MQKLFWKAADALSRLTGRAVVITKQRMHLVSQATVSSSPSQEERRFSKLWVKTEPDTSSYSTRPKDRRSLRQRILNWRGGELHVQNQPVSAIQSAARVAKPLGNGVNRPSQVAPRRETDASTLRVVRELSGSKADSVSSIISFTPADTNTKKSCYPAARQAPGMYELGKIASPGIPNATTASNGPSVKTRRRKPQDNRRACSSSQSYLRNRTSHRPAITKNIFEITHTRAAQAPTPRLDKPLPGLPCLNPQPTRQRARQPNPNLHPNAGAMANTTTTTTTTTTTATITTPTTLTPPTIKITPPTPQQPLRPPNRRASLDPPPLSTTPLTPATLKCLLDTFDAAFSHTHYAVCGRAALAVWGYRPPSSSAAAPDPNDPPAAAAAALPAHVGILCPEDGQAVILSWARVVGWAVYPPPPPPSSSVGDGDGGGDGGGRERGSRMTGMVGVPLSGTTEVVGFRLRTVEAETWWRLEMVRPWGMPAPYVGWVGHMIRTNATVVAVPTLLNEFARAWYCCMRPPRGGDEQQQRNIAGLILWILWQLMGDVETHGERARWKLTMRNVPIVSYWGFWCPFVAAYPEALNLMKRCGVPLIAEP